MRSENLIFLLVILVSACSLFPNEPLKRPMPNKASGPIVLDFTYQNSITVSGWVRFDDLSSGIEKYEWNFGFTNNGEVAKSYLSAPKIRFPENGNYWVELIGVSYKGDTLKTRETITVSNY